MLCKNCGAQLTGTENVCPNCGSPVEKETTPEVNPVPESMPVAESVPVVEPTPVPEPVPVPEAPTESQPETVNDENNMGYSAASQMPAVDNSQPVDTVPESTIPDTMSNPAPMMGDNTVTAPMDNMSGPVQPPVPQPTSAPVPTTQSSGKNSKTPMLIILLVALLAVGAVVYFTMFKTDDSSSSTPEPQSNSQNVSNDTTSANTVSYSGYKFVIPDGYQSELTEGMLAIYNNYVYYMFGIDYSHNYDAYKQALAQKYPSQINDIEKTFGNRKYLMFSMENTTEEYKEYSLVDFITPLTDNEAYIGGIAKADGSQLTTSEMSVLNNILDGAKKEGTSFAAGDDKDLGKDGIKIFSSDDMKVQFSK